MIVKLNDMLDAISAINLVPSRAGIAQSEFVRVAKEKKKLTFSLAGDIFGQTFARLDADEQGDADFEFFADRMLLIPFIMLAKEYETKSNFVVQHELNKKGKPTLFIKTGRRKALFRATQVIKGYTTPSKVPEGAELKLNERQRMLMRLSYSYATHDPTVAHLNCIYLLKNTAILASNNYSIFSATDPTIPVSLPFPTTLLNIFESGKIQSVWISKKMARVELPYGALCQMTSQKAANFPVKPIIGKFQDCADMPKRFTIPAKSMLYIFKRLEACVVSVIKRDMVVRINGDKGDNKLIISCDAPQGKFTEVAMLKKPLKEGIKIEWILNLLLPLARFAEILGDVHVHYDDQKDTNFFVRTKYVQLIVARKVA